MQHHDHATICEQRRKVHHLGNIWAKLAIKVADECALEDEEEDEKGIEHDVLVDNRQIRDARHHGRNRELVCRACEHECQCDSQSCLLVSRCCAELHSGE